MYAKTAKLPNSAKINAIGTPDTLISVENKPTFF